ncbi:oligopeptide ABC transporter permease OppB [Frigidibacter sp. SD6-1]|uniref:oligopeptide ABC transporter permease OppB n=1 Tax=Frigidibacter sp. SD6-1 TaxID=3032581 RepID=UPI0024DF3F45|nr:oligopeptide ABC transporter permease OppB [Frigidibacter sp. SD6-1]
MFSYIIKRLVVAIPTLLVLMVLSFLLMHAAPGGPFTYEKKLPPEVLANLNAKYGLDQPLWRQMVSYVWGIIAHFDFGPSFVYKDRDVNEIIAQGFPVTLYYGSIAFVVAVVTGVTLGVVAAVRQNSLIDYFAVGLSIGAQVLPNFVMAPVLVLVFALWLGWLPAGGWEGGEISHVILPVIALATSYMASIARITRSSMLEVLTSNHVRTARAKGLPEHKVILRHALKPSLIPVISYLGPAFVAMITGSVVVDSFFSTGGIGKAFVDSALNRDYAVMMGITLLVGVLTIIFNLLVDILYAWIDPKIRY